MADVFMYEGKTEDRQQHCTRYINISAHRRLLWERDIVATDNWYTSKEDLQFVRDTLGNNFL